MTSVGETYRPPLGFSTSHALAALILGLMSASLAAALVWFWEISPIPTLLVATSALQGIILGGLLGFAIDQLRLPNPRLALGIGLIVGLFSVAVVHLSHYAYFALSEVPAEIASESDLLPEQQQALISLHRAAPFRFTDEVLRGETGQGGPFGYLKLRANIGEQIGKLPIQGPAAWGLWIFEGLIVILVTTGMVRKRASRPFCQACQDWCEKETGLPTFPEEASQALLEAIRSDTPAAIEGLRRQEPLVSDDSAVSIQPALSRCLHCEQAFLNLSQVKGSGRRRPTAGLLKRSRISPEMAAALRGLPKTPAPVSETDSPTS